MPHVAIITVVRYGSLSLLTSNREVGCGHPYIVVDSDAQCVAQLHAIVVEVKALPRCNTG